MAGCPFNQHVEFNTEKMKMRLEDLGYNDELENYRKKDKAFGKIVKDIKRKNIRNKY